MDFNEIRYEIADQVLTITLDRPERLNAYTATMQNELLDAFDRADADDGVRVVVVTGAGRGFCAGADLERGGRPSIGARARPRMRPRMESRATEAGSSRCGSSAASSRSSPRSTDRPWAWGSR